MPTVAPYKGYGIQDVVSTHVGTRVQLPDSLIAQPEELDSRLKISS